VASSDTDPSAVKRIAVQGNGHQHGMRVQCESTQSACDKLRADFQALKERMRDSLKSK